MSKPRYQTPPHPSQESNDGAPKAPLLSILNVVVDHVMMPPSPMEPVEFREVCRWKMEKERASAEDCTDDKTCDAGGNENGGVGLFELKKGEEPTAASDGADDDVPPADGPQLISHLSENVCIKVPVLRIFGPVLRDGNYDEVIHSSQGSHSQSSSQEGGSQSTNSSQPKRRIQQPQSGCLHLHGAYPYMLARPIIAGPDGSMNHGYNFDVLSGRINWDDPHSVSNILEEVHCRLEMALRASYEHHDGGTQLVIPGAAVGSTANRDNLTGEEAKKPKATPLFIRQITIVTGRGFYTYCSGPPAPFLRVEYYDPAMRWRVKMVLERGLELNELYHPDPRQYDYTGREPEFQGNNDDSRPLRFRCYEAHIPYTMQVFKDLNLAGMKYVKVGEARFRNPLPRMLRKRTKGEFGADATNANQVNEGSFFLAHNVPSELLWPKLGDVTTESRTKLDEYWLKKQTCCDLEMDSTVQQLLNVLDVLTELPSPLEERQKIHWRAVPSLREVWEQERKRMSVLLPPEDDFLSCKEAEGGVANSGESDSESDSDESAAVPSNTPAFTLNVKKGASLPGTRLAVKGVKKLFQTSVGLEAYYRRALSDILSKHEAYIDSVDRSMKANGSASLNGHAADNEGAFQQQEDGMQMSDASSPAAPGLDAGIEALAALGDQFSQYSPDDDEENEKSPVATFGLMTPIGKSMASMQSYGASQLSQKEVEEQEEMLAFGQQVDSDDVFQLSRPYNGDRVEQTSFSLHDGEDEFDNDEDDGFLAEEERMGEAGLERALTQLATQAVEPDEEPIDLESDADDSHLEVNYHHSQMNEEDDHKDLSSDDDEDFGVQLQTRMSVEDASSVDGSGGLGLSNLSQPSNDSAPGNEAARFVVEEYITEPDSTSPKLAGLSQKYTLDLPSDGFDVGPEPPPGSLRCGEIAQLTQQSDSTAKRWHALPNAPLETCPPWFQFQYEASEAPFTIAEGAFLEPVKRPPSYSQVKSWTTAHRKRPPESMKGGNLAKQQKVDGSASESQASSYLTAFTQYTQQEESQSPDPLAGLGQQGCQVQVSSGGGLKTQVNTATTFTPLTIMSIEVHVQCRISTGAKDRKDIAMVPDSSRDAVFAAVYVYGRDPGGGESLEILERGCVLVTIESRGASPKDSKSNLGRAAMGLSSDITVERVQSERSLLLRMASIVQLKDPDALVSWDTQGGGLGYLVERGAALGKSVDSSNGTSTSTKVDMARLLGRTPRVVSDDGASNNNITTGSFGAQDDGQKDGGQPFSGSGLGAEWDDRVGAGAAAASIVGRIVLCGWKICSQECKHPNASYQPAIVSAILNKRIPFHDDLLLTKWYSGSNGLERRRVIEYRLSQAMSNVLLFDALDVLGRAGEAARLSGVEFSQSLPGIRGSQYKVEGVLLRALQSVQSNERGEKKGLNKDSHSQWQGTSLTASESQSQSQSPWKLRRQQEKTGGVIDKTDLGYFFYSPSKLDCSNQEALECQAMTLEPKSGFHFDPVIVCDFTALYPSLVIAYNLCYSTVAGKLDYHSTRQEMRCVGRTTSRCGPFFYSERRSAAVIKHHMKSLDSQQTNGQNLKRKRDRAYAIPTGSIFVSESVLKGVLPQVLDEMLSTRAMLKKAAKQYKKRVPNLSPAVLRQIEARQLALKYVANVTYGYTSATFSGRSAIPLVADAIVECGRRTLTNAIDLANSWGREENGRWSGAHVLYGDTDSVFIKLPGRSVKEAFAFGEEYCRAVTACNPPPVQLKLEKVYSGCLLQTKKKYCGMMYEAPTQRQPTFEAKGIETVRRDQCVITQRVLKNALVHAFQRGIGPAKEYLFRQWALIHAGKMPVSDFVLTGRVRSRYRGGKVGPVQASLAKRLAEVDPGRVVRHKERLPYVIVAMPGRAFRLRDGVLTPLELLEQWDSYSINADYYTVKHVNAALQRCFGLPPFKISIETWYNSCPKPRKRLHHWPQSRSSASLMISSYFGSDVCALCGNKCKSKGSLKVVVCQRCKRDSVAVACTAIERLKITQQQANSLASVCSNCNGCIESSGTFARKEMRPIKRRENPFGLSNSTTQKARLVTPIANCVCIDCPVTYERHRLRESEIEAMELCRALDLN